MLPQLLEPPFNLDLDCRRLSPAALRTLPRLANLWRLNTQDFARIAGVSDADAGLVLAGNLGRDITPDELLRASALLGIYKALNILFADDLADIWVQLPNNAPLFGGLSAVQLMARNGFPAMINVRRYLEAICQGY